MMGGAGEFALPLIQPVIERLVPSGIDYVRTWLTGKDIIVLGPPRVGKTSFLDYLQYGILRKEQPTDRTIKVDLRQSFILKLGRNGALVLRMWKPIDLPGDFSPLMQVEYIGRRKPNGIVIVLDATSPFEGPVAISSIAWLEEFCIRLDKLLWKNLRVTKELQTIITIMNKWDRFLDNNQDHDERKSQFEGRVKNLIDQYLKASFQYGKGDKHIPIMPCSLVKSRLNTTLADEIVNTLALNITR